MSLEDHSISSSHATQPEAVACNGAFYGVSLEFQVQLPQAYPQSRYSVIWDPKWLQQIQTFLSDPAWLTESSTSLLLRVMAVDATWVRDETESEEEAERDRLYERFARAKHLAESHGKRYDVFAKTTVTNKVATLQATDEFTVGDFKEALLEKTHIPIEQQILFFAGRKRVLYEDWYLKLTDFNFRKEDTMLISVVGFDPPGWIEVSDDTRWRLNICTVAQGFQRATMMLWNAAEAKVKRYNHGESEGMGVQRMHSQIEELFQGRPSGVAHWILRCNSPNSNIVWSPETDKMWPFLFRLNIRYLTKIKVAQGSGELIAIPLEVVAVMASYV